MTNDEIEEISKYVDKHGQGPWHLEFAKRVAAKEREACAKACDDVASNMSTFSPSCVAAANCAERIRERA